MLDVEPHDGVTVLRLAHGRVNAMDLELLLALDEAIRAATGPIVLTGTGSCFSAGVDLRRIVGDGPGYTGLFLAALSAVFRTTFRHPAPVVAAVNGHALAGGCVLALAADHRIMSLGTIGLTEMRVGVPFPTAALEIVRYAAGPVAGRLALTGDALDAEHAERLGVVDERCAAADLMATAVARAARMAGGRPEAYAATKAGLHADAERAMDRDSGTVDPGVLAQWTAPDTVATIAAFLDRLAAR